MNVTVNVITRPGISESSQLTLLQGVIPTKIRTIKNGKSRASISNAWRCNITSAAQRCGHKPLRVVLGASSILCVGDPKDRWHVPRSPPGFHQKLWISEWKGQFSRLQNIVTIWQCVKTNSTPVVHIKIAGKWMFIPLKMVLIGIDPYPYVTICDHAQPQTLSNWLLGVRTTTPKFGWKLGILCHQGRCARHQNNLQPKHDALFFQPLNLPRLQTRGQGGPHASHKESRMASHHVLKKIVPRVKRAWLLLEIVGNWNTQPTLNRFVPCCFPCKSLSEKAIESGTQTKQDLKSHHWVAGSEPFRTPGLPYSCFGGW